jgi:hypothetical protein
VTRVRSPATAFFFVSFSFLYGPCGVHASDSGLAVAGLSWPTHSRPEPSLFFFFIFSPFFWGLAIWFRSCGRSTRNRRRDISSGVWPNYCHLETWFGHLISKQFTHTACHTRNRTPNSAQVMSSSRRTNSAAENDTPRAITDKNRRERGQAVRRERLVQNQARVPFGGLVDLD